MSEKDETQKSELPSKSDGASALDNAIIQRRKAAGLSAGDAPVPKPPAEATSAVPGTEEVKTEAGEKAYLLPSAPCSFIFSDGTKVAAADGVIKTSDEKKIEELEAAVAAGNIQRYEGRIATEQQIAPGSPDDPRLRSMA